MNKYEHSLVKSAEIYTKKIKAKEKLRKKYPQYINYVRLLHISYLSIYLSIYLILLLLLLSVYGLILAIHSKYSCRYV